MNPFERTVVLTASLAVLGAVVALPSVLSGFPFTLLLLPLPAGLTLFVPRIHRSDPQDPAIAQLFVESAGPWVGYAVAFHAYHGVWDYQGVIVGVVGFAIMAPIAVTITYRQRKLTVEKLAQNSAPTDIG